MRIGFRSRKLDEISELPPICPPVSETVMMLRVSPERIVGEMGASKLLGKLASIFRREFETWQEIAVRNEVICSQFHPHFAITD
jgi:hypothetical protein